MTIQFIDAKEKQVLVCSIELYRCLVAFVVFVRSKHHSFVHAPIFHFENFAVEQNRFSRGYHPVLGHNSACARGTEGRGGGAALADQMRARHCSKYAENVNGIYE